MSYYVTDSIYILNNKTYYEYIEANENENENTKKIKLNKSNWFKYLQEYGWEKMCRGWKRRLKENNKNSCFGVLECGSDGDCLFHVIAEALNSEYIYNFNNQQHDVLSLRKLVSEQINDDNFSFILNNYVIEKACSEFNGEWDPDNIKCKEDLQLEVEKCGNNFWGDHILLQLLQTALNINVIILKSDNYCNSNNDNDRFVIHSLCDTLHQDRKTIIIYYFEEFHFQLVGYFDGNIMKTLFNFSEIPTIIMSIYNLDTRKVQEV